MPNIKDLALIVNKLSARLKFSKKWVKLQDQIHSIKKLYPLKRSFQKRDQSPRSKSQDNKICSPHKGLFTRNIQAKYQSSNTRCSIVISKVKVLKKDKLQGQGQREKK